MTNEEVEQWIAENSELAKLTVEEFGARLEAQLEDLEAKSDQESRDRGIAPLSDVRLFLSVARGYQDDVQMSHVMENLRLKKRRGHRQQKALELWNEYYKSGRIRLLLEEAKTAT